MTEEDTSGAADDIKQLGFGAAIASLGYVFWVVGGWRWSSALPTTE
ncbi:MAG: hypothetical protein R3B07_20590 [Polyangiaceae bacterium]